MESSFEVPPLIPTSPSVPRAASARPTAGVGQLAASTPKSARHAHQLAELPHWVNFGFPEPRPRSAVVRACEVAEDSPKTAPELALAHRVSIPDGLAGALLTSMGGFVPGGNVERKMLHAAIVRLAPRPFIASCKAQSCCWRWAAERLLDEYATLRAEANTARAVLLDELGHSVRQELLNLQQTHDQTSMKLEAATKAIDILSKAKEAAENKNGRLESSLTIVTIQMETAKQTCVEQEERSEAKEEKSLQQIRVLKQHLDEYKSADKALAEMRWEVEDAESKIKDANTRCEEALAELAISRRDRHLLQQQAEQLHKQLQKSKSEHKRPGSALRRPSDETPTSSGSRPSPLNRRTVSKAP